MLTEQAVLRALATIEDPDPRRDIVSLGFIKDLRIDGATVAFTIELTTPACPVRDRMKEHAYRAVLSLPGVKAVDLTMTSQVWATRSEQKDQLVPLVKNIVPILPLRAFARPVPLPDVCGRRAESAGTSRGRPTRVTCEGT